MSVFVKTSEVCLALICSLILVACSAEGLHGGEEVLSLLQLQTQLDISTVKFDQRTSEVSESEFFDKDKGGAISTRNVSEGVEAGAEAGDESSTNEGGTKSTQHKVSTSAHPLLFMNYMPSRDMIVCSCAKCGSVAFFGFIFRAEKGYPPKDNGPNGCDIQDVTCPEWQGTWAKPILDHSEQELRMKNSWSYALIRDPKERLVSAWKSKLACDSERYGRDFEKIAHGERYRKLLRLADVEASEDDEPCMSLDRFIDALHRVKQLGRQDELDTHFLPQHLGCFADFPPSKWSRVFTGDDDNGFRAFAERLGSNSSHLPHVHTSSAKIYISEALAMMLDDVTSEEYEMLQPYLSRNSSVIGGALALPASPKR